MKKLAFHRCLRLVPTMTSAQRHDLKIALEQRDKNDLVAEVASLVGIHLLPSLPSSRHQAVGPCSWAPAVSVPGVQTDLRSVDGYPLGGASSQGPVAFLPGEILRGRIGQKGRLALRHQQENRLPLAASFSGTALGPPGLPGERNRRGGRRPTFCVRSRDNGIFRDVQENGEVGRRSADSPSSRFRS